MEGASPKSRSGTSTVGPKATAMGVRRCALDVAARLGLASVEVAGPAP